MWVFSVDFGSAGDLEAEEALPALCLLAVVEKTMPYTFSGYTWPLGLGALSMLAHGRRNGPQLGA